MKILCDPSVDNILDLIYTDYSIAYVGRNFSNAFTDWNYKFCNDISNAINTLSKRFVGTTCVLDMDFGYDSMGVFTIMIHSCNINMPLIRNVETQSNKERISVGLPSVKPSTLSSTPTVNVAASPRYTWALPTKNSFTFPKGTRVSKRVYLNRFKLAYYNHRYTIVNLDNTTFTQAWFDGKPRFFNKPYGKYKLIAYVNYHKSLFAVDANGNLRDMHRLWDDAFLKEQFAMIINMLITETINDYLSKNLLLAS